MKWKTALYDTLSLVLLDALLRRDGGMAGRLPRILAIEQSFMPCHMRGDVAERMKSRTEYLCLPGNGIISDVFRRACLPITIADIDALIYVAAVHYKVPVITGDKHLEEALRDAQLAVRQFTNLMDEPIHFGSNPRR